MNPNIYLQVSPEISKETDRNESGDVGETELASAIHRLAGLIEDINMSRPSCGAREEPALTSLASNFDKTIEELDKNVKTLTVQLRASI